MISFVRLKHCQIQIDIPLTGLNFPRLYSHGLNLERPKFDARQSPLMPVESRLPSIPVDFNSRPVTGRYVRRLATNVPVTNVDGRLATNVSVSI